MGELNRLRPPLLRSDCRLFPRNFPWTLGAIDFRLVTVLDPIVLIGLAYRSEGLVVQAGQAECYLQFFSECLQRLQVIGCGRDFSL